MTPGRAATLLVGVAVLILVFDLATKAVAEASLDPARPVRILGDNVRLTLVHNSGTAFGLFPGRRGLFIFFSFLAIAAIVKMYQRLPTRSPGQVLPMAMLLGGAAGNLHDRVRFGVVTDFIQVGVAGHYWPVFNVADSAITVGVTLLVLGLISGNRDRGDAPGSSRDLEVRS